MFGKFIQNSPEYNIDSSMHAFFLCGLGVNMLFICFYINIKEMVFLLDFYLFCFINKIIHCDINELEYFQADICKKKN